MPAYLRVPATPYNRMSASPAHAVNRVPASPQLFPAVSIKNIAHRENLNPLKATLCTFNVNINYASKTIVLMYLRNHVLGAAERT